mgnify:CR=1 FL=1
MADLLIPYNMVYLKTDKKYVKPVKQTIVVVVVCCGCLTNSNVQGVTTKLTKVFGIFLYK